MITHLKNKERAFGEAEKIISALEVQFLPKSYIFNSH